MQYYYQLDIPDDSLEPLRGIPIYNVNRRDLKARALKKCIEPIVEIREHARVIGMKNDGVN
tara:strand:+ start:24 stop:206 length:183 start_codon:yes stop_codon:yes gene_type:complete